MTQGEINRALDAVGRVMMFLYGILETLSNSFYRSLWWLWNVTPWHWPVGAKLLVYPGALILLWLPFWLLKRWRRMPKIYGQAQFAGLKELRGLGMLRPNGRFLGQFVHRAWFRWQFHDLFLHGEGHCLTIAAQGSGKTTGIIIPTLITYTSGTVVVTDPKGAITAQMRRYRKGVGRVVILNPWRHELLNDPAFGVDLGDDGFNPLQSIDTTEEGRSAAKLVASLLLPDIQAENPFWRESGRELLEWCMLWQSIVIKDPAKRVLPLLHGMIYDMPELTRLLKLHSEDPSQGQGRAALKRGASSLYGLYVSSPATFAGMLATLKTALSIYDADTYLGRHVSASPGFRLADLKGVEPLTLFVICPPGHLVSDDRKWLNLVLAMVAQEIGKPGLARETVLLMDEFPALGYLPNLAGALEQFREAGLRAHLIAQNPGQIVTVYGADGLSRLWGACETKQFFRIADPNHAKVLSEWLGQRQAVTATRNAKGELSESLVGVPLIRPEELTGMKDGRQVMMRPAMNPVWARVMPYFQREAWRAHVDPNPYREPGARGAGKASIIAEPPVPAATPDEAQVEEMLEAIEIPQASVEAAAPKPRRKGPRKKQEASP
jgi:type IV secretion system protein VirD4